MCHSSTWTRLHTHLPSHRVATKQSVDKLQYFCSVLLGTLPSVCAYKPASLGGTINCCRSYFMLLYAYPVSLQLKSEKAKKLNSFSWTCDKSCNCQHHCQNTAVGSQGLFSHHSNGENNKQYVCAHNQVLHSRWINLFLKNQQQLLSSKNL